MESLRQLEGVMRGIAEIAREDGRPYPSVHRATIEGWANELDAAITESGFVSYDLVRDEFKRLEDERDAAVFQQELAVHLLRIARAYVYERYQRGNKTDAPARPGFVSYDLELIDKFLAEFPESSDT